MTIESVYANRMNRGSSRSSHINDKIISTKFKVGDNVIIRGADNKTYVKGKIISLIHDMHIEGEIVKYSSFIDYPVGDTDIFVMGRDGKRELNGSDFTVYKTK